MGRNRRIKIEARIKTNAATLKVKKDSEKT